METNQRHYNRASVSTGYDIEYSVLLDGQYSDGSITQTGGDRKKHTIFSFIYCISFMIKK